MPVTGLDSMLSVLGMDPDASFTVFRASDATGKHVPPFPPDLPALIVNFNSLEDLSAVKHMLAASYPDGHEIRLIYDNGKEPGSIELKGLPQDQIPQALLVPALSKGHSFEAFQEVIARLRAPDGCPWDMEQTHLSLRKHLLEESYEALAAMDAEDPPMMREEYGDLLLQIVLNAQIATEAGEFKMGEVLKGIHDKIIRRHPHVFGDLRLDGVGDVLQNWERLKAAERSENGNEHKSLLDSLPSALPALTQAQEFQARASRVGFAWKEIEGVLDKVSEEIAEVREAQDETALTIELGDLFFALANLARWKGIDAEAALREASSRFKSRFGYVERAARQEARPLSAYSEDELIALWQAAKSQNT